MKKLIPWIGYCGSLCQNTYSEDLEHGYLVWDIDVNARKHDVEFITLPNPRPFVTVEWAGSVDATYESASVWPQMSRFRIKSAYTLPSSDAAALSIKLRKERNASEVVFKSDDELSTKKFASASVGVDVRSLQALERMLHEYYSEETIDDTSWEQMHQVLAVIHPKITCEEDLNRGTMWTIKSLEWDGLYGYGSDNYLNLEDKSGIIGVFGPNKIGKSSIVGTITYTLFNSADRDASKNAYVVNMSKKAGSARAIINVAGSDYELKRNTTKVVSRGFLTANTTLTIKQQDGEGVDLTGEQRGDTEKNLRKLIGTYEDFALTNGQVQDDVGRFLKEGATQRKAILSRFLGIDVFEKLYSTLNSELNEQRNELKNLPLKDNIIEAKLEAISTIEENESREKEIDVEIFAHKARLNEHDLKIELHELETKKQACESAAIIDSHRRSIEEKYKLAEKQVEIQQIAFYNAESNVVLCETKLLTHQPQEQLDARYTLINQAKLTVQATQADVKTCNAELERSKRIASKLNTVPCGDNYPTCSYIKDAHEERSKIKELENSYNEAIQRNEIATTALVALAEEELENARISRRSSERELTEARKKLVNAKSALTAAEHAFDSARREFNTLHNQTQIENYDQERYELLFKEYQKRTNRIAACEYERRNLLTENGKCQAEIKRCDIQLIERERLETLVRVRELLVNAFSRRGIPNIVLKQLLPTLNAEMDKVLDGVVNFRVYLKADEDTNALDILLDDGVPRPLELGSGMERFVGSLALRVALSNLTTLPKPDFMIIDEGFGSLDDDNAMACVSLLRTLKRWFRFVLVISHVDAIKESVDSFIEIYKSNDESCVKRD